MNLCLKKADPDFWIGETQNIEVMQADAENLPFEENHFDCVTIAFGLRNDSKRKCPKSMHRVLKPGGKMLILEFFKPNEMLSQSMIFIHSIFFQHSVSGLRMTEKAISIWQNLFECIRIKRS